MRFRWILTLCLMIPLTTTDSWADETRQSSVVRSQATDLPDARGEEDLWTQTDEAASDPRAVGRRKILIEHQLRHCFVDGLHLLIKCRDSLAPTEAGAQSQSRSTSAVAVTSTVAVSDHHDFNAPTSIKQYLCERLELEQTNQENASDRGGPGLWGD